MALYELLAGKHSEGRKADQTVFVPGDIIESPRDLVNLFGKEKFKKVDSRSKETASEGTKLLNSDELAKKDEEAVSEVDGARVKNSTTKIMERRKAGHDGGTVTEEDVEGESEEEQKEVVAESEEEEDEARVAAESEESDDEEEDTSSEDEEDDDKEEEDSLGEDVTDDFVDEDGKHNVYRKGTKYFVTNRKDIGTALEGSEKGMKRADVKKFISGLTSKKKK